MGISGLLPLLKSIHRQRHLSEFAGETVAVDAYVWLHRGAYACASELALGKPTHKYVDYAMHRVRLLRHHGITPYIVFDGGPLPAKQGTEESRATKRAENLARGKALAAQGQHARARECFCKCVDVTPQMAFQFIKALRAENVPYVVAPYEADAQMAYLEANGVVSAILTEDSDLLVFGCRTVLLKLDATSASVTSISHADFGTILPGWTHSRFRAMAILSGCDYLASLSGVGLKTARAWLSAHETVEKALAAARLSGKIRVPSGYLENFNRAQAVFLHQRVFDSTTQQLVNLTPPAPGTEFDAETDAYIGRSLDAELAARIALGNACPISLQPMVDINAGFVPRPIGMPKALAMTDLNTASTYSKGKGKTIVRPVGVGAITQFFTSKPPSNSPKDHSSHTSHAAGPSKPPALLVGTRSGKRTLASLAEDVAAARTDTLKRTKVTHTRFFPPPNRPMTPVSPRKHGKENTPVRRRKLSDASNSSSPEGEALENLTTLSVLPLAPRSPRSPPSPTATPAQSLWDSLPDPVSAVTQEDGYLSPPPTQSDDEGDELSSPARPRTRDFIAGGGWDDEADEGDGWLKTLDPSAFRYQQPVRRQARQRDDDVADILSSPPRGPKARTPIPSTGAVLVPASPFHADACSDIEDADSDEDSDAGLQDVPIAEDDVDEELLYTDTNPLREVEDGLLDDPCLDPAREPDPDPEDEQTRARTRVVAQGWWKKYARRTGPSAAPLLRRRGAFEGHSVGA